MAVVPEQKECQIIRPLCGLERMMTSLEYPPVQVEFLWMEVEFSDDSVAAKFLNENALRIALTALQRRQPLLRSRIVKLSNGTMCFQERSREELAKEVENMLRNIPTYINEEDINAIIEKRLTDSRLKNMPTDDIPHASENLWEFYLYHILEYGKQSNRFAFLFLMSHTILDGMSALVMQQEFLDILNDAHETASNFEIVWEVPSIGDVLRNIFPEEDFTQSFPFESSMPQLPSREELKNFEFGPHPVNYLVLSAEESSRFLKTVKQRSAAQKKQIFCTAVFMELMSNAWLQLCEEEGRAPPDKSIFVLPVDTRSHSGISNSPMAPAHVAMITCLPVNTTIGIDLSAKLSELMGSPKEDKSYSNLMRAGLKTELEFSGTKKPPRVVWTYEKSMNRCPTFLASNLGKVKLAAKSELFHATRHFRGCINGSAICAFLLGLDDQININFIYPGWLMTSEEINLYPKLLHQQITNYCVYSTR